MKNILNLIFIASLLIFLNRCPLMEDTAKITIRNVSDNDIKNITVVYNHGQNGKQTRTIDKLKYNTTETINVNLQNSPATMTFTSPVEIQYYINGKKHDVNDEENVNTDAVGTPYTNAYIGGGNNVIFSIKNNSYSVTMD